MNKYKKIRTANHYGKKQVKFCPFCKKKFKKGEDQFNVGMGSTKQKACEKCFDDKYA